MERALQGSPWVWQPLDLVSLLGKTSAAVLFAAAVGVGIWEATAVPGEGLGWESRIMALWATLMSLGAYGLLALGGAWVADALRGSQGHPSAVLQGGAAIVFLSGVALGIWQAVFFDIGQVSAIQFWSVAAWGTGLAGLVLLTDLTADYLEGYRPKMLSAVRLAGVVALASGLGAGIWTAAHVATLVPTFFQVGSIMLPLETLESWAFWLFWRQFLFPSLVGALLLIGATTLEARTQVTIGDVAAKGPGSEA